MNNPRRKKKTSENELHHYIRELGQRRQQRQRRKTIGLMSSARAFYILVIETLRQRMVPVLSAPGPPANRSANNFKLSQVSESFVANELKKLKSNKSTGLHNIPARLLQDGADALATPLAILMNRSMNEGSIPQAGNMPS